jgi:aspartate/methionine/tyrosine aminotransferase
MERKAAAVRLDPTTATGIDSPMAAALALLADRDVSRDRELLDLSQAAPPYPPAPEVVARVVEVARAPDGAAYTPVPGIPPLRRAIADELSRDYAGSVEPADVVVTAGCNQAFSLVANALAGPGDEVITPLSPTRPGARRWSACTRTRRSSPSPATGSGCVVAAPELNREVLKLMDCVAICAPRIGQEAALAGLTRASTWRRERAAEIAQRRAWLGAALAVRPGGFEAVALGGFFAWVRHPFPDRPTSEVVRNLVCTHDTLVIPGTAFLPDDRRMLRLSAGRIDEPAAATLARRLTAAGC